MDESILGQLLRVTAAGPVSGEQARAALERGKAKLAAGERDAAAVALREAAMVPETQLAAHNLIEAENLPGAFSPWMGLDATIDPRDDVYGFFTGFGAWSSPMRDYLADGWRTLSELMLLLEQAGRSLVGFESVLEFASGHGRFTRHLARAIGAQRVTVSDVVAGAVDFARAHCSAICRARRGSRGLRGCGRRWRLAGCWCFPRTVRRRCGAREWSWMRRGIFLRCRASPMP